MSALAPLTERNLGWLRYLHRKATTPDSWDRQDHPHEHWDNTSEAPMLCYHRFDLIDSTYAVALMADRTPAWREVYEQILDELTLAAADLDGIDWQRAAVLVHQHLPPLLAP